MSCLEQSDTWQEPAKWYFEN